jgi:repressor LexA
MPTHTPPTERQKQVLRLVEKSVEERGYPPSLRELSAALGLEGTRAVEKHVDALRKKGYLKKGRGARALESSRRAFGRSVPIVGRVAAGSPLLAEQNLEGTLALDNSVARWDGCFLLRVKGHSMKDKAILDGDLVLVKPQADADDGETVVALVDGEATVKTLRKRAGRVLLEPANAAFKPIVVEAGTPLSLAGKVVGVFRYQ